MRNCRQFIIIITLLTGVLFYSGFMQDVMAEIIPSSRIVDWSISGSSTDWSTTRTTICTTLSPSGGNDAPLIQSALNLCPAGQVVKLSAGTFRVSSTITWPKNGVSLRGNGSSSTILQTQTGGSWIVGSLFFLNEGDWAWTGSTARNLSSGYTKGSTQVVTSVAHGWVAGDYVLIDQLNVNPPWNINGYYGNCTWCSRASGTRLKGQTVRITSVPNSTTANFTPPLYDNYDAGYTPQGVKNAAPKKEISVESLKIDDTANVVTRMFYAYSIYDSVFYDIEIAGLNYASSSAHFFFFNASFNTFRRLYLHDAESSQTNNGYGVFLHYGCSANLIENSIFRRMVLAVATEGQASGNVIAYNYALSPYYINGNSALNSFTLMGHGAGSWFTLYEGNIVEDSKIRVDAGFGSQNNITMFRNRISQNTAANVTDGRNAIDIEYRNWNYNMLGNVLGTSGYETTYKCYNTTGCTSDTKSIYRIGYNLPYANIAPFDTNVETSMLRHRNWDSVTNGIKNCGDAGEPGCQGGDGSTTLPNSYYLTSKPSYFGSCTWPAIGADLNPMTGTLPAKDRYNATNICVVVSGGSPPQPPSNLTVQ